MSDKRKIRPVLNPKAIKNDARFGELGMIRNPSGGISTEFSITEFVPELGGWVNIPSLVKGQIGIDRLLSGEVSPEHSRIAIKRAIQRVKAGAKLPAFKSMEEAVENAKSRTEAEKMLPFNINAEFK